MTYGDSRKGRWRLSLTPALGLFGSEVWFHHRSYFKMPGSSILLGPIPALSTCTLCSPLPHTRRPCLSAVSLQPEVLNSQSGVWVYVLDPHRDMFIHVFVSLLLFHFRKTRTLLVHIKRSPQALIVDLKHLTFCKIFFPMRTWIHDSKLL